MPYHLFVSISPCGSLLGRHGKTVIDMCFPDSCVIFDSSLCFSVRYWNHASVALIGFSGWHLIEFCFAGRYLSPETWRWHGVGDAMVWKDVVQHPFFVDGQKLLKWTVISEAQSRVFFSVFCWVGQTHRWEKLTSTARNPIRQIYRRQTASALSVQCLRVARGKFMRGFDLHWESLGWASGFRFCVLWTVHIIQAKTSHGMTINSRLLYTKLHFFLEARYQPQALYQWTYSQLKGPRVCRFLSILSWFYQPRNELKWRFINVCIYEMHIMYWEYPPNLPM